MQPSEKLYVVTRRDLSPGQQAVQSIHAAVEFCLEYPQITRKWHNNSNYLVFLAVNDEEELGTLCADATETGISFAVFHEPDIDDELTAIAIEPAGAKLCKGMRLAL